MRSRNRADESRANDRRPIERKDDRQNEQHSDRERERTKEGRVPKIQYRFLRELEERALAPKDVQSAYDMAQKIRRYPLESSAVMSSWERFTKTAIEDYKAGAGSNDARDQQHRAYAVLFSAIRNQPGAKDLPELQGRVREVALKNSRLDESGEARRARNERGTRAKSEQKERSVTEKLPPREQMKNDAREAPTKQETPREGRTATQRTLALQEKQHEKQQKQRLDEQNLDARVDKLLGRLRQVPAELRGAIEGTAIDMLVDGFHSQKSARQELPDAVEELRREQNAANTVNALTLATIARMPEHAALLEELRHKNSEEQKEIGAEARKRLERYPALESGVSLVKRDQIAAAVHDVLEPSMESHKEALVLAKAREQLEAVADPKRLTWERYAPEMISATA